MRPLWMVVAGVALTAMVVAAFVISGGAGSTTTLSGWVAQSHVGQSIGTLEADDAHVHDLLHRGASSGSVRTLCAAMSNDAETANGALPSPDTKVTEMLARAYGLEYDAAQACYRAGTARTRLLARAASERASAKRLFGQVVARIRAATGESVTTTTSPGVPATGTAFG